MRASLRFLASLLALLVAAPAAAWAPNGVPVCTVAGNRFAPQLVADGSGGVIFVWEDYRSGFYEHYAQRLDAAGNRLWPAEGLRISSTPNHWGLTTAPDDAGGVYVCWYDTRQPGEGIYLIRLLGSGEVAPGWPEAGWPLAPATFDLMPAQLARDGEGGVFAKWDHYDGVRRNLLQRVTSGGAVAQGWPAPFVDALGGVFDLWFEYTPSQPGYFVHRSDGLEQTDCRLLAVPKPGDSGPNPPPLTAGPPPDVVADHAGGMFFAWLDYRSGEDITALRLSSAGTESPGWSAAGLPVVTGPYVKGWPRMASVEGGVVIVWSDTRNGNWDVYHQRVMANGTIPPDAIPGGEPVAALSGLQNDPVVVSDGEGGAIVSWVDNRDGGYHLYAQRIAPAVLGVPPTPLGLDLRTWPNPSRGSLSVSFVLHSDDSGALELLDVTGRRVAMRQVGALGLGRHTVRMDEASSLAAGIYLLRFDQGGRRTERKVAIVR